MDAGQLDRPFQALGTIQLSVTGTLQTATFTSSQDINAPLMVVSNASAVLAYMGVNSAAIVNTGTPLLNSIPLPASSTQKFYKGGGVAVLSFITSANTATILVTACKGA